MQFLILFLDKAIDEASISVTELGKALGPYQKNVNASLQEQEKIVAEIQEVYQHFVRENGVGNNTRDVLLKQLASSYDVFTELQNNLKEGTKFYNDLTELLIVFQNKISDFCFARKTEKNELMKDLTTESSRQPLPVPGSTPAHHSATTAASAPSTGTNVPYPTHVSTMPIPYGVSGNPAPPYTMFMPPMPQCFNPYATLPYPSGGYPFPQGPPQNLGGFGTWPGSGQPGNFPQGNYPH